LKYGGSKLQTTTALLPVQVYFGLIIKKRVLGKICELFAFVRGRVQNDGS